ncbi:MAG: hypothetical protein AAF724_01965 [Pseudomonadota bacterium]
MNIPILAAIAALLAAPAYAADSSSNSGEVQIEFVTHVQMDMSEQDVFVERAPGDALVFRATKADADMSQPLFATAQPVKHNPADPSTDGPHRKGAELGVTLGEWLNATGKATYVADEGAGLLKAEFEGLVPNGVYTMWHFFMASAPTDPFIGTFDLPVGAPDGSQSVFVADAQGNAVFERTLTPGLQMTAEQLAAGLAIAWHSDGKTYGVLPGDFAYNSHIQLFAVLPQ